MSGGLVAGGAVAELASPRRLHSLDGLRGAAALVVVLCHSLLVVPEMSASIVDGVEPDVGSPAWWLLRTPLRVLILGSEAVMVFFILSGFVLMLMFIGKPVTPRASLAYLLRRCVRLYLPVWGSLGLALLLAAAVPRNPDAASTWVASHPGPEWAAAASDAVLLFGTSNLNSPLWSLTWEMWFSLLLPLFVVAYRMLRVDAWWHLALVLCIAASTAAGIPFVRQLLPLSHITGGLLRYMPIFVIGMILASKHAAILDVAARIGSPLRWVVGGSALALLLVPPLVEPMTPGPVAQEAAFWVLSLVATLLVVLCALCGHTSQRFLETRSLQWLGTHSFSLYLVHEPIVVSCALLVSVAGWMPWLAVLLPVLVAVLVASAVFYRLVEHPSLLLSRRIGRLVLARPSPGSIMPVR